jgi:hypothetical protein
VRALRRVLSAANSPWLWPIAPLLAVAAVGQWVGVTAAGAVAAVCGAIGIGIIIGLTMAGDRGARRALRLSQEMETPAAESPGTQLRRASPGEMLAETGEPVPLRAADLRGARLAHTRLVRADLRRADLRGATLTGADLTDADLTDALLGPLEDSQEGRAQA